MIAEAPRSSWPATASRRFSTASDSAPPVRALARAQGSQFTSAAFTGLLTDNAIAISMDGRGAWRDCESMGFQAQTLEIFGTL